MQSPFIVREHCPVCAGQNARTLYSKSLRDSDVREGLEKFYGGRLPKELLLQNFTIQECDNCNLIYTQRILKDEFLAQLYNIWMPDLSAKTPEAISAVEIMCHRSISLIPHLQKRKNPLILDFGAGGGMWAKLAIQSGYDVFAVEINESSLIDMNNFGVKAVSEISHIASQFGTDCRFDYIYVSQVFEHLARPFDALRAIAEMATPGAILLCGVPNGGGLSRRLKSGMEPDSRIDPFAHIQCFDRRSMERFMALCGFRSASPLDAASFAGGALISGVAAYSLLTQNPGRLFVKE